MPTKISAYSPTDTRAHIADWVEVQTLVASNASTTSSQLIRATTIIDEPVREADDEDVDEDAESEDAVEGGRSILDQTSENLSLRVYEELEYRISALGDLYPFELTVQGANWKLSVRSPSDEARVEFARAFYLTGLVISSIKYKFVSLAKNDARRAAIPQHMQLMSYLVAADYVHGEAYWMGWPRPDDTTKFRTALDEFVKRAAVGKLLVEDPEWDAGQAKDGTVDLVAWRSFRDGKPGKTIMYGQVASGRNWRTKPLHGNFDPYFEGWFQAPPSKEYLFSMFIPFVQHEDCKPKQGQVFSRIAHAQATRDERRFGIIFDRLRITELAPYSFDRLEAAGWSGEWDLRAQVEALRGWSASVLETREQATAA